MSEDYLISREFIQVINPRLQEVMWSYNSINDSNFKLAAMNRKIQPVLTPLIWWWCLNYWDIPSVEQILQEARMCPYYGIRLESGDRVNSEEIIKARISNFRISFLRELDAVSKIYKLDSLCRIYRNDKEDIGEGRTDLICRLGCVVARIAITHDGDVSFLYENIRKKAKETGDVYYLCADDFIRDKKTGLHIIPELKIKRFLEYLYGLAK